METAMAALNPCASSFCPSAKASSSSSGSRQSLGAHQTSFVLGSSSASLKPCVSGRVASEEHPAKGGVVSVRAKGRRSLGMPGRQPNRQQMPAMPNMEGDDTPKFVLFIRTKNVRNSPYQPDSLQLYFLILSNCWSPRIHTCG
jgi:hypothetical protein